MLWKDWDENFIPVKSIRALSLPYVQQEFHAAEGGM